MSWGACGSCWAFAAAGAIESALGLVQRFFLVRLFCPQKILEPEKRLKRIQRNHGLISATMKSLKILKILMMLEMMLNLFRLNISLIAPKVKRWKKFSNLLLTNSKAKLTWIWGVMAVFRNQPSHMRLIKDLFLNRNMSTQRGTETVQPKLSFGQKNLFLEKISSFSFIF